VLDESQALQLAYTYLEKDLQRMKQDNQDLVARWMQQKSRDADIMNAENDTFVKKKEEEVKQALKVAAEEPVDIPPPSRYLNKYN